MPSKLRDPLLIGAVAGILFYLNALIPRSYLYPLLWPLVGGGVAAFLLVRGSVGQVAWVKSLAMAGAVGFAAGLFFLLPGLGTLYAVSHVSVPELFATAVIRPTSSFDKTEAVNSAIIAFFAIPVCALIGGFLGRLLLVGFRNNAAPRHHAQPA